MPAGKGMPAGKTNAGGGERIPATENECRRQKAGSRTNAGGRSRTVTGEEDTWQVQDLEQYFG